MDDPGHGLIVRAGRAANPADIIRRTMVGDWSTFFAAQVGAGAALTGLVFVALSINLKQILSFPGLPSRSAEAIILLMQPVIVGALVLIPEQRLVAVGIEILVVGATDLVPDHEDDLGRAYAAGEATGLAAVDAQSASRKPQRSHSWLRAPCSSPAWSRGSMSRPARC